MNSWVNFDLKFEISDVKYLVKFGGKTFRPAKEARTISGRSSGQISAKFSETSFEMSRLFSKTSFIRRAVLKIFSYLYTARPKSLTLQQLFRSRFLGRGSDEALFSENKGFQ